MKFTTHLELHSQTTRLVEGPSPGRRLPAWHGILTLCDVLFQGTWAGAPPRRCLSKLQLGGRGPQISNLSFCRFTRRYWGNPCWFLFLRLLICLSSAGIPA